ncbi:MAG: right-handed parallel beta-helix repeat-containing protein, partial [candidate division NC10 bacterium]|nr:right-handed parallel beta-helix repeat-containing protein [candidate division NC10 bacterium]
MKRFGTKLIQPCLPGVVALLVLALIPFETFAAAPGGEWWDSNYAYREKITVTAGSAAVPSAYSVSVTFDHAALVSAGNSQADGDDVRLLHWNGSTWTELDRALDPLSSWNDASTQVWFSVVDAIGASGSDDNYYLYYGNTGATGPPADWANVFMIGDNFDDGTLTSGVSTSTAGTASITETGGEAFIDLGTNTATDAGIIVTTNSLPSDNQFAIRHKMKVFSGGGGTNPEVKAIGVLESASQPLVADAATENPRRRIIDFARTDGQSWIFYYDTGGNPFHWNGTTWVSGVANWGSLSLDTYYIHELISDGTNWYIRISDANGTAVTTTTSVAWTSVQDTGDPFWFYWGEAYTDFYFTDVKSDWVYVRDYVDPEPSTALGAEEIVSGLLAQYWVDEAATGQGIGNLIDNAATPLNMPIDYPNGTTPVWNDGVGINGNRNLRFTGPAASYTGGALVSSGGTKMDALHGATQATLEAKYVLDNGSCSGEDSRIFGLADDGGSGAGQFYMRMVVNNDVLAVMWAGVGLGRYSLGAVGSGCPITPAVNDRSTVHWVIDTTQAVAANRVRAYINGVATTVGVHTGILPSLNDTINLGVVGNREMFLGRIHSGSATPRTFNGNVWYAAAYNTALDAATVAANAAAINACDDLSVPCPNTISGTVFEDINYGGGDGRTYATADTSAQASGWAAGDVAVESIANIVELYDNTGAYISTTSTDASGLYSFNVADGTYYIRAINSLVDSQRPSTGVGNTELGVQTFRTDASGGSAVPVINEVGGRDPTVVDAGSNDGSSSLNTATFVFTGGILNTEQAQSVTQVVVSGAAISNIDFGYNFDTVVNTNNASQGSLRQFILNSNELDNVNLDQEANTIFNPVAGTETTIFMIPETDGGRTASPPDGGTGFTFVITPTTELTVITDNATSIDGRVQESFTGDDNAVVADVSTGPEVVVVGTNYTTNERSIIEFTANNITVHSLGLGQGGNNAEAVHGVGPQLSGPVTSASVVQNNTIWDNGGSGVRLWEHANPTITNNIVRGNGTFAATADGIYGDDTDNATVTGNSILDNGAYGIDINNIGGSSDNWTITNNTIRGNGANASGQDAGIGVRGGDNTTISGNTITGNQDDGIVVLNGNTGNVISQNSIFNNGDLGIDLTNTATNTGDGVTANDDGDPDTGANNLLNFPVIETASIIGSNLVLTGFAPAGSSIELFIADAGPNPNRYPFAFDFGEGQTYLSTLVEGS